jgi:Putative phage tail protein
MATLVLSVVGSIIAGPVGAILGATAGNAIDRALIGGPTTKREGPRLHDLSVQSSAYGEPIPLVFGTARVAGNMIWSSGLIETRQENTVKVGGKGGGKVRQVSYSYSASLAVGLAARAIQSIGRIWADGKLIRTGVDAPLTVGGTLRVHNGNCGQARDPLLEAALGVNGTPAYRGLAYVTIERLELAEFANRVPNLTFEVIADTSAIALAKIAQDLANRSGLAAINAQAWTGTVTGYVLGRDTSARTVFEALSLLHSVQITDYGDSLRLADTPNTAQIALETQWLGASTEEVLPRVSQKRTPDDQLPREVSISYSDPARDYQSGLQRARRMLTVSRQIERFELPAVLSASDAKQTAERALARAWTERRRLIVRLPWRHLALVRGDAVNLPDEPGVWAVEDIIIEGGVIEAHLVRVQAGDTQSLAIGSSGAVVAQPIVAHGVTTAHVFELPSMGNAAATTPTLLMAATGASTEWRRALIYGSTDAGATFDLWADIAGGATLGLAASALDSGPAAVWDLQNSIEVDLLHPNDSLESRADNSVLAGSNLFWLNGEIIQFAEAELITGQRWRLSRLLRGRFGTEATAAHTIGEPMVVLTNSSLASYDLLSGTIGRMLLLKALSPYETIGSVDAQSHVVNGLALRPPCPVHLSAKRLTGGAVQVRWVRRSRAGYDWLDGVDAPLAEVIELYDVEIRSGAQVLRTVRMNSSEWIYSLAEQNADFGSAVTSPLAVSVYQISALVGRGLEARRSLTIME